MDCLAVDFLLTLPDEIGADTVDNGDDDFLEEVVAMEIEVCCLRCHAESTRLLSTLGIVAAMSGWLLRSRDILFFTLWPTRSRILSIL